MTAAAETLAFRARALAQAHPLTALAGQFVARIVTGEQAVQIHADVATWAGAELVAGYCLRRVEEDDAGLQHRPSPEHDVTLEQLDAVAREVATALRIGDPEPHLLGEAGDILAGLNAIIAAEIDARLHNFREEMDSAACDEFADYVTAWVVTGYAVRV
nr:hypothetical protein [Acidimicrobiia bacterium]